ncbi:hypothetical protein MPSI1_000234 [Malassezia psittaci]|uniref:Protein phosphatase inhibitor 2 (IPP-2) n=1 Tax=Malassezia psittaci TaxID=1821823 RepID=A0AAF0FAX4_9BASI|nr:hypothetical protein MPSI1_000234 [Malassezia psittaci]
MPPKSEPIPSAAAPKVRGILKNAKPSMDPTGRNDLHWDESNLSMNEEERVAAGARMTIDEPKTPFVHSAPEPPMEEESFDLDKDDEPSASADQDNVLGNTQANATISSDYLELKQQLAQNSAVRESASSDRDHEEDAEKHSEFNQKRNKHYGNEAQALKQAAMMQDDGDAD